MPFVPPSAQLSYWQMVDTNRYCPTLSASNSLDAPTMRGTYPDVSMTASHSRPLRPSREQVAVGPAAVEQRDVMAPLQRIAHRVGPEEPGAAEKQYFQLPAGRTERTQRRRSQ